MNNYRILRYDTLESTNKKAKECAHILKDKDVILAKEQTAGRGRMGRTWISQRGADLIMSLVLKPKIPAEIVSQITLIVAMAVCDGLEKVGKNAYDREARPLIKWPNDVLISSKKVCGILTESLFMGERVGYVVVGVGVNVSSEEFHFSIEKKAGSIKTQWGLDIKIEKLLDEILKAFDKHYERFVECQGVKYLTDSYNSRLVSFNKEVFVKDRKGICRGINEKGELMVEFDDEIETICAGEIMTEAK